MTVDEARLILEGSSDRSVRDGIWAGLELLNKYKGDENIIQAADHDKIWSVGLEEAIEQGLTREEVINLRDWGWFDDGGFAHYV